MKRYLLPVLISVFSFGAISCDKEAVTPQVQDLPFHAATAIDHECGMVLRLEDGKQIYDNHLPNGVSLRDGEQVQVAFTYVTANDPWIEAVSDCTDEDEAEAEAPADNSTRLSCHEKYNIRQANIREVRPFENSGL